MESEEVVEEMNSIQAKNMEVTDRFWKQWKNTHPEYVDVIGQFQNGMKLK